MSPSRFNTGTDVTGDPLRLAGRELEPAPAGVSVLFPHQVLLEHLVVRHANVERLVAPDPRGR